MPAKRKTTTETTAALRRLIEAEPDLVEATPGLTVQESPWGTWRHENLEPCVHVLRRRRRVTGTVRMRSHPLVEAVWATLPRAERRRSRLFFHCLELDCPVRFTKKGAIADARRHGRIIRYAPATEHERLTARQLAEAPVPRLDPRDDYERMVAEVWSELTVLQRKTLYVEMRPSGDARRVWALVGATSPQAYDSRVRSAYRALARALGRRFTPGEYELPTAGRTGFDYERFFDEWNLI